TKVELVSSSVHMSTQGDEKKKRPLDHAAMVAIIGGSILGFLCLFLLCFYGLRLWLLPTDGQPGDESHGPQGKFYGSKQANQKMKYVQVQVKSKAAKSKVVKSRIIGGKESRISQVAQ